ncbi:MAG: Ig-like domain-containing protein [Pseudomonadota bacterium]
MLRIEAAAPVVEGLTLNFLVRDGQPRTFVVQGRNFSQVTSAALLPADDLILQDFTPINDRIASLTVLAGAQAALGARVLQLTGINQSSSSVADAFNTLFIIDEAQIADRFVTPLLGVQKGMDGMPDPELDFYSNVVSVIKGAVATQLEPDSVEAGATVSMTVTGQGLDGVVDVSVDPDQEIVVENLAIATDGSRLDFDLIIGSGAEPGARTVILNRESGTIAFSPFEESRFFVEEPGVGSPIALSDQYELPANGQLQIEVDEGLLINDIDPQGQALFAVLVGLPASGDVSLAADGSFSYTPEEDFVGQDQFRYVASNGMGVSAAAIVRLTVEEPNNAVDDAYSLFDNEVLSITAAQGLLANDVIDSPNDVEIVLETNPQLGEFLLNDDGSFTYTPMASSGVDTFTYRLITPSFASLPATVRITITNINEPPEVNDDSYVADRDELLSVNANQGVLANDRDPDQDALLVRTLSTTSSGVLALSSNGSFTYQPNAGFVGQDQFTYEATDPEGLSDQATVTITVNDTLLAVADSYELIEDEVFLASPEQGLLANDSAIAQGELRIVLQSQPQFGQVEVANDGSFVYQPEEENYFGTDSFSYFLQDDVTVSPAVLVTLNINPVNDPPTARSDSFIADENVELIIPAPGVLDNDSDPENEEIVAELISEPESGTVQLNEDGSFSYVPEVNFRGLDTFEYRALDGSGAESLATVEINVTQPPTATNDVYFVDQDTAIEVTDPEQGLLINDHDAPEDDVLSAVLRDLPINGLLELNADGTFLYVPNEGFVGIDTFTYQASDGLSESNIATVTLPVGITSFPRAIPDEYEAIEDETLTVDVDQGLLQNDEDADTPLAELTAFLVSTDFQNRTPLNVTVNLDGSFSVTPWPDFTGETFFVYQAFDGTDISNAAVVTINVQSRNDGVFARDDEYSVLRNTLFRTQFTNQFIGFNDDIDEDFEVNFEVLEAPEFGLLELDPLTGSFQYTPDFEFSGTDTFRYRVFQIETGISDEALVTLRVNAPPVAVEDQYVIDEDSEIIVVSPLVNDFDVDGDVVVLWRNSFNGRRPISSGFVTTITADELALPTETRLRSFAHFYGDTVITYRITDGRIAGSVLGTINVSVLPVPEAPIAVDDSFITQRDTDLVVNDPTDGFTANDFDPDLRPRAGGVPWQAAQGLDLEPFSARLLESTENGVLTFSELGTFSYSPNAGYSGTDAFVYELIDATGRISEPATARIIVNSPAQAVDDSYVVNEDTVLTVPSAEGLLSNDFDIDGDPLRARIASPDGACGPCNGRVSINSNGGFTYTPNLDFHGQDRFNYRVEDNVNGFDIGTAVITVLPVNDAPKTEPDTYRIAEDEVLVAPQPQGVLRNDEEVDGDGLADAELLAPAANGSVTLEADGGFTYVPDVNFNGMDTFAYRIFDTTGLFSDETVEIQVTPINDAPIAADDAYKTAQDQPLVISADQGVLANDLDVDSPRLTTALILPTNRGLLELGADGAFVYRPDGTFTGVDRFSYQVDDGLGAVDSATVTITVSPIEPDVQINAANDFYTFAGPDLDVASPGVLANDTLTGAKSLQAVLIVEPEVGVVSLQPDGGFSYSAPDGFEGVDGFSYSAEANGVSDLARVTLNVFASANNPPQAVGEAYLVLEDDMFESYAFAGLLENDSDFENDELTVEISQSPLHGQFELFNDGHFRYTPNANYFGQDQIVYRVSDGSLLSNEVTATITVVAQNDPPVAQDDSYRVEQGTLLQVDAANGLLANDSDIELDELLVEAIDQPANGQILLNTDGSFDYTPNPDFTGLEQFNYAVTDLDATDIGTVSITVGKGSANRPPVAVGESFLIDEDELLSSADVGSLLDNDFDPDGDEIGIVLIEPPGHGVLMLDGGEFEYRPERDFFGQDRFRYAVTDGELNSNTVDALIDIQPINDAPVASTDFYSVIAGQTLQVDADQGVLQNDTDVERDPLSAVVQTQPAHGDLTLQSDGSFSYRSSAAFTGQDEFLYRVDDGQDVTQGRVVITVDSAGNQAPTAVGEQFLIAEDSVLDTRNLQSLLANDSDPDNDPLELVITGSPAFGDVQTLPDGHIVYAPDLHAVGTERISYEVSDGALRSLPVLLEITLQPINDPPEPVADIYIRNLGAEDSFIVSAANGVLSNDTDPDQDALLALIAKQPEFGNVTLSMDGGFEYQLSTPGISEDRWRYLAVDPSGEQREASVLLILDSDPPVDDLIFGDGFEGEQP